MRSRRGEENLQLITHQPTYVQYIMQHGLKGMTTEHITSDLKFLHWQKLYEEEKPFQIFINIPEDAEDQRNTNLVFEKVSLQIQDVRNHPNEFSLDTHGFVYRQHAMNAINFSDQQSVRENYLPEMEVLLQQEVEGADRIFFFDWRVCRPPTSLPSG